MNMGNAAPGHHLDPPQPRVSLSAHVQPPYRHDAQRAGRAPSCEKLAALALPNTTITSAQLVPAGPFTPPAPQGPPGGPVAAPAPGAAAGRGAPAGGRGQGPGAPQTMLPAHCRVAGCAQAIVGLAYRDGSVAARGELERQVPGGRQRRLGGQRSAIPRWRRRCRRATPTASNDTGHKGGNALFAIGHPEKLTDFAYRAVHEMTVQSKAIITSYYGRPRGCPTGTAARPADVRV